MIQVDLRSRTPIYEQLYENIKTLILKGVLVSDERLPSVRELAATLTINPNTIQKAFTALENDGYIYVIRGRGSFVSAIDKKIQEQVTSQVVEQLNEAVRAAKLIGMTQKAICDVIKGAYDEEVQTHD